MNRQDLETHNYAHTSQHSLALVGVGNTLRQDDGIASRVLDSLPGIIKSRVCWLDAQSHTQFIPEFVDSHSCAIIIDAVQMSEEPGSARVFDLDDLTDELAPARIDCSHAISWLDELRLSRVAGNLPERVLLMGIQSEQNSWGNCLSEKLAASLPKLVDQLVLLVKNELANHA